MRRLTSPTTASAKLAMSEADVDLPPQVFAAPMTLCLDLKNPLCYLALRPAFELADELGIALTCLPFAAAALPEPVAERPGENRGTRHRRLRAEYVARDIARYAEVQNLQIRNLYRSPDTTAFAVGLLWLNAHAPGLVRDYLQILFEGYWCETLDILEPGTVVSVLRSLGQDAAAFSAYAAREAPRAVAELREKLVAAGVFNVPSFVVEGQVFLGRAHLPMVRWLLQGKRHAPPI